jgi:hypothetical protein
MHSTASPRIACSAMSFKYSDLPKRRRIAIAESCSPTPTPMPAEPNLPNFLANSITLATSGC